MSHVGLDRLKYIEDDVDILDFQGDFTEVLVCFGAQCWLEIFVRRGDQVEPEAPVFRARVRQYAAIDLAENFFNRVCVVVLEQDYALLGLLCEILSASRPHRRHERQKLTLNELVAPHSLRKYSFCLQRTSLCTFTSRPSLSLRVRSLYSASLYQPEEDIAIDAVSSLRWYEARWRVCCVRSWLCYSGWMHWRFNVTRHM